MTTKRTITKANGKTFETWSGDNDRKDFIKRLAQEETRTKKATKDNYAKSYSNGYIFEAWSACETSEKTHIGSAREVDLFLNVIDAPKKSGGILCTTEVKFGGADLTNLIVRILKVNGFDVLECLDNNSLLCALNTCSKCPIDYLIIGGTKWYGSETEAFFVPVIGETLDMLIFLCDNGLIRFEKSNGSNRNGCKLFAIQPNKSAYGKIFDAFTVYIPTHKYNHAEIIGKADFSLTQKDYAKLNEYNILFA